MIFMPPRHGKSEMATVRFPVWCIEQRPATRVIIGAYNQLLAQRFSRRARAIATQRFGLSDDQATAGDWETPQGGGVRAVGVGSGVTGHGGDIIVIDDPIKSREEAESLAYRDRVWNWYRDDLYTRREPGAAMILIQTRWHEDDLAGRILASDDAPNWAVVSLPAEAEENDPLGRAPGSALCPERFDLAALADIKSVLLPYSYSALYQQRPVPREGGMFKRDWFKTVQVAPTCTTLIRAWDRAATAGGGDYTVGVLMGKYPLLTGRGEQYIILDVKRGQWDTDRRDLEIYRTAYVDNATYGHRVKQVTEQEPGSAGKDVVVAFVRMLKGLAAYGVPSTGDKVTRADPFASQAAIGNVKLLAGAWVPGYLDELCSFPEATHDDQVDGSSAAFKELVSGNDRRMRSY